MEEEVLHNTTHQNEDAVRTRSSGANNSMPSRPTPSVVRCLFPEPNCDRQAQHDNSKNILRDIISADAERMRDIWNYDIENDKPLNGPVKWEKPANGNYDWIGYIPDKQDNINEDPSNQDDEENPKANITNDTVDKICETTDKL